MLLNILLIHLIWAILSQLAYSMLESFTPQMGITIEEENILVYISEYISRKVSRSAYDQCKVILILIINCDPSARNESHVGSVQVEKMCNMHDMG